MPYIIANTLHYIIQSNALYCTIQYIVVTTIYCIVQYIAVNTIHGIFFLVCVYKDIWNFSCE